MHKMPGLNEILGQTWPAPEAASIGGVQRKKAQRVMCFATLLSDSERVNSSI
jgi:hypothetical protein